MAEFNIPGVYSEIDASAAVTSIGSSDRVIGIIAKATSGTENQPYAPISYDDAKSRFGADSNLVKLMKTAMENGGSRFILVRPLETAGVAEYADALEALELEEAVKIVITDSTESTDHALIKSHVAAASSSRRERIAVVGHAVGADQITVQTAAESLNSGRVYTAYPNPLDIQGIELSGIYGAAAVAGQIAGESDPSMPLTNVQLSGFFGLSKKLRDSEMNALILAGVIPLEVRGGNITIVRAISTYTKNSGGTADITWQELTTTSISDFIINDLRNRLSIKFGRAKQNQNTRNALKSEVLTALLEYQRLEYLENVLPEDIMVSVNPADPTRNDIIFKYDVVTPLNVIHLTGHLVL